MASVFNSKLEIYKLLKNNSSLSYAEERKLLYRALEKNPEQGSELALFYLDKSHKYLKELNKVNEELKAIADSPWFPGHCISLYDSNPPMAMVAMESGRRALVAIGEGIDLGKLKKGTPVLLNQKMNMVLKIWDGLPLSGEVGQYDRTDGDRIIVKTSTGMELVLQPCEALKDFVFRPGDPVLFDPNSRLVLQPITKPTGQEYFLEEVPDITFNDVGGLDEIIEELVDYLDLNFFHPEIVLQHNLRQAKGLLLVSLPGLGKTTLAKGIANYCTNKAPDGKAKFMNIPPGSHRKIFYGATEGHWKQLFSTARDITKDGTMLIMFFDELDNIGRRGQSFGNEIDSRTMTAFLAELDGLQNNGNILVIGATNREDLIDTALKRPKRFGDRIFKIARPDREAASDIFNKYLTPDLPFYSNGRKVKGEKIAQEIIEMSIAHLYAPNSPRCPLLTLTFRNGEKLEINPEQVISGAMIENIVRKASYRSCIRTLRGNGGICPEDVLTEIDDELDSISQQIKNTRTLQDWLDLDQDTDVVNVAIHQNRSMARHYQYVLN